jgi:hypothetical protein
MHWSPFIPVGGDPIDLSFLDAHKVTYAHNFPGKETIFYEFWVTYSFHCFAKDYERLTAAERLSLMYHTDKDSRPFCYVRYNLAKVHLKAIIENLGSQSAIVRHAGYESYATTKIIFGDEDFWYLVPFKVYRENKKFRLHITSAYPVSEEAGGGKVKFFTIAHNLKMGKKLPTASK